MNQRQLTSPHIVRATSAESSNSMEVVTDPCFRFDGTKNDSVNSARNSKQFQREMPKNTEWGPPILGRKENAWEEGLPDPHKKIISTIESRSAKKQNTSDWVDEHKDSNVPQSAKAPDTHPMSVETQAFLASMVNGMRDELETNTGVMALLDHAPVSVFEEQDITVPVDYDYQDLLNSELEDFLNQIKHIRDGPSPIIVPSPTGEVATQLAAHLDQHKGNLEAALAQLDRELASDSGVDGSDVGTDHEDEFRRLVMERQATDISTTPTSTLGNTPTLENRSDQGSVSVCVESVNTQSERPEEERKKEDGEMFIIKPQKKLDLYGWLDLHPDPKVRKAAIKMKRLDEQLRCVIQKEREVKKQRYILNKQLLLFTEGATLLNKKEEVEEEVLKDDLTLITELQDGLVSPIFMTTQNDDDMSTQNDGDDDMSAVTSTECSLPKISDKSSSMTGSSMTGGSMTGGRSVGGNSRKSKTQGGFSRNINTSKIGSPRRSKTSGSGPKRNGEDKKKVNNKNFIARNKELANDASAAIAMTEAEKERLIELLHDIDEVDDDVKTDDMLALYSEEGFSLSREEKSRMEEIDSKLIIEEGGALSICSGQTALSFQSTMITELDKKCPIGKIKLGEDQLKRQVQSRNEQDRIELIDQMLIQCAAEEQPELPPGVLEDLLSQCRSEMGTLDSEMGTLDSEKLGSEMGTLDSEINTLGSEMLGSEHSSVCISPVL